MTQPKTPEEWAEFAWNRNKYWGEKSVLIADITEALRLYGLQMYNAAIEDAINVIMVHRDPWAEHDSKLIRTLAKSEGSES